MFGRNQIFPLSGIVCNSQTNRHSDKRRPLDRGASAFEIRTTNVYDYQIGGPLIFVKMEIYDFQRVVFENIIKIPNKKSLNIFSKNAQFLVELGRDSRISILIKFLKISRFLKKKIFYKKRQKVLNNIKKIQQEVLVLTNR